MFLDNVLTIFAFILLAGHLHAKSMFPQQTLYNEEFAKKLLNFAAGAYSSSFDECVKRSISTDYEWKVLISNTEVCDSFNNFCSFYSIAVPNLRELFVIFRGTKTKKQLLVEGIRSIQPGTDFFGHGKVNQYFFHAHITLWDDLEPILTNPEYKDFNVTFSGHSLGGALSSLAAMRTVMNGHRQSNQVRLYTFGQPRVGCSQYAAKHDALVPHSFRIVNRLDIVPHMPPCEKNKTYSNGDQTSTVPCDPNAYGNAYHHGTEIWYPYGMGPSAKFYECLGMPKNEDFNCSDSVNFELSKYKIYISDHRHYFDHKVPSFGKLGCGVNVSKTQEEAIQSDANSTARPQKSRFFNVAKAFQNIFGK